VAELSLALGIAFGFLSYELVGLSPGGIVTPGYVALFMDQPVRILGTLLVSIATFLLVRQASRFFILFGRRRFAVVMLASFLLRWVWEVSLARSPVDLPELRVIGFIVPGLIANDMERQGVLNTAATLLIVASILRLVLLAARAVLPL
jgi:poly-gamma-glutamate biosynthesis protein PgsC/CapC